MKIGQVDVYHAGHWVFVAITAENGVRGIGESTYFTHPAAVVAIIDDLRPELLGADAGRPEFLFQRLFKHHCLRDAAEMGALSAIDQALWDVKARTLGVPIHELFGGRVRDRVRAILLIEADTPDALVAGALKAREDGFTAIKIKPFLGDWAGGGTMAGLKAVARVVKDTRDALGEDIDIAIEIHRNLTPDRAISFVNEIKVIRPYFIEDPILPFGTASTHHVAASLGVTVALAERNTNIWEFRDMSDCHAIAILRPDVGLAGGYTQMRKIAAIAESRHQRIVPHNFTAPVSTAAHVQLAAATVNWDVQGYVREDRSPWRDVVTRINTVKAGYIEIPDTPGLGLDLNDAYLAAARAEPFGTKFHHGRVLGADGGVRLL